MKKKINHKLNISDKDNTQFWCKKLDKILQPTQGGERGVRFLHPPQKSRKKIVG